jgi:guanine deaminase
VKSEGAMTADTRPPAAAGPGLAIRADLLDFTAKPALEAGAGGRPGTAGVRFRPDHWLRVDATGRIVGATAEAPAAAEGWHLEDHRGHLLLPGFVDAHVHSAQGDSIASWGASLLDWLEHHTFPAEARHADAAHAQAAAEAFCDALPAHGTTCAAVFPTVHPGSVDALFGAAGARGLALAAGKVLMDRHAPEALLDTPAADEAAASRTLLQRWHGRGRFAYAVTPRFAPTSSPAQLALAGRLAASAPGLVVQTHLAENPDEVRWVRELFPQARSYLDVYAQHGLVRPGALFAHGIHVDDEDRRVLAEAGAAIVHCPSSNLFLGSGLFDWRAAEAAGVRVAIGSDIGGGTGPFMPRTLLAAYQVQAMQGARPTAFALLHAATRGGAEALGFGARLGSFEPGQHADLALWRWAGSPIAARRQQVARDLHERLFAWLVLAGEADLVQAWVDGRPVPRPAAEAAPA